MMNPDTAPSSVTRRNFIQAAGAGAVATGLGLGSASVAASQAGDGVQVASKAGGPYNILFILVDQQRFFRPGELPAGFELPAQERLAKRGTSFVNHTIN